MPNYVTEQAYWLQLETQSTTSIQNTVKQVHLCCFEFCVENTVKRGGIKSLLSAIYTRSKLWKICRTWGTFYIIIHLKSKITKFFALFPQKMDYKRLRCDISLIQVVLSTRINILHGKYWNKISLVDICTARHFANWVAHVGPLNMSTLTVLRAIAVLLRDSLHNEIVWAIWCRRHWNRHLCFTELFHEVVCRILSVILFQPLSQCGEIIWIMSFSDIFYINCCKGTEW